MHLERFPSRLLENAVNEFAKLPGIGRKSALRLVLHLLKQEVHEVEIFANSLIQLRSDVKHCRVCHNISDTDVCNICSNPSRNKSFICVVENIKDVMAIENTHQFNGLYHVLGGAISPLDGIGPDQLTIDALVERIKNESIKELIFALNPTIQGDTTIYYIGRKLKEVPVKITTIARGIAFGGELEFADEMTLAKSISNRIAVEHYINAQ